MTDRVNILVVDDEPSILRFMTTLLEKNGYNVTPVDNSSNAKDMISSNQFDIMLSDIEMRPVNGIALLKEARKRKPTMPVLMITGYGDTDIALEALKLGAFDYVTKPFKSSELLLVIERALAHARALV